jgi:hypothetical protein
MTPAWITGGQRENAPATGDPARFGRLGAGLRRTARAGVESEIIEQRRRVLAARVQKAPKPAAERKYSGPRLDLGM